MDRYAAFVALGRLAGPGGDVLARDRARRHRPRVSFIGVVATIGLLAAVLAKLSDVYEANRRSRGLDDTGHYVLEAVLVVSAGLTLAAFVVWFFFFAGASPVPVGIQI